VSSSLVSKQKETVVSTQSSSAFHSVTCCIYLCVICRDASNLSLVLKGLDPKVVGARSSFIFTDFGLQFIGFSVSR
jgi:hypothetical protein